MKASTDQLRTINRFLSLIIIGLAIYIIATPFWPNIIWWANHHTPLKAAAIELPSPSEDAKDDRPKSNTLIIPALSLRQPILEGQSESTLNQGLWHLPGTGDPVSGSNTVIAGHRFLYGSSTPFYHLDKIKTGDKITVYWQGERYDYQVSSIQAVEPTQISVLGPTNEPTLTIFTCTPLWTAKQRLIVQAHLTEHTR